MCTPMYVKNNNTNNENGFLYVGSVIYAYIILVGTQVNAIITISLAKYSPIMLPTPLCFLFQ